MLWIWCSKHFSLSANAWIKSVISQKLSLGFLQRYAGNSCLRFAATRGIQKSSFFQRLTEDPEIWRPLDARSIREALLQVDEKYRVALELFYLNNLSYREIGDALGMPIGTVMSRLSRGKAQLQSILSDKSLWRW
jgi:RNA polymerase sigma factor (sigma-70 family)